MPSESSEPVPVQVEFTPKLLQPTTTEAAAHIFSNQAQGVGLSVRSGTVVVVR